MILLLDTATATCHLTLIADDARHDYEWEAGRTLAKGLLEFLQTKLQAHTATWHDVTGLGVFEGPGSFTGLRIGLAVMNTLADSLQVPIVGARGDVWQDEAIRRLKEGENQQIVLPFYGGEANITTPRK